MKTHSLKGARRAAAIEADMSQPIRGKRADLVIVDDPMPRAKHKRHRRPKDALDPTPPLFEDLPRLIYCPRRDHYAPASAFGRNKNRPSGLATYCKECRKEDARKERAHPKHPDRRLIRKTLAKLDRVLALIAEVTDVPRGNMAKGSPEPRTRRARGTGSATKS